MRPSFLDINFKYTDAQSELAYAPELIAHAFVDIDNATESVLNTSRFIVYGPKGSGKTALAARLKLSENYKMHVEIDDLESFDFRLLRDIEGRGTDAIGGSLAAWKAVLIIRAFSTLSRDNAFMNSNPGLVEAQAQLLQSGFLRRSGIAAVAEETARRGAFERLASIFAAEVPRTESRAALPRDPAALVGALEGLIKSLRRVPNSYFLLLDGLDYPLRKGLDNTPYLVELLSAVTTVNGLFAREHVQLKLVLLMRDEVLKILPDPNLAKRLIDHGISLNWYDNVREPFRTKLLEVIGKRAKLAGFHEGVAHLFRQWFPHKHGRPPLQLILEHTRHLPRDLISVFREFQGLGVEPPFTWDNVNAGLRNYSDWFYDELADSLVGLIPEEVRTSLGGILGSLGAKFDFNDFREALIRRRLEVDMPVEQIGRQLFISGWIGNVVERTGGDFHYWQHRGRRAEFDPGKKCMVHRGLRKALNLVA